MQGRQQGAAEQAQTYGQQMGNRQQGMAEQGQRFGQDLQLGQARLGQQAQNFGQARQTAQDYGAAEQAAWQRQMTEQGTQFGQAQTQANMQNALRQQQVNEQLAMGQQGFGQQMQQAGYQQQLRQAAIAEEQLRRTQPLNEINAMLSGQQIQAPNMPSFQGANRADTTNYMGAAQNQYQGALNSFNAEQAAIQGMMGGIAGLGGAFMPF